MPVIVQTVDLGSLNTGTSRANFAHANHRHQNSCDSDAYHVCLEPFFGHEAEYEMTLCEQYYGAAIAAAVCGLEHCGIPCEENTDVVELSNYHDGYNCGALDVCPLIPELTEGPTSISTVEPTLQPTNTATDAPISEYEYQSCNTGSYHECLEPFFGHAAGYEMTVCEQYYGAAIAAAVCGLEYCGIPCEENAGVVDLSYYHDSYNCGALDVCSLIPELTDAPTNIPTVGPTVQLTNTATDAPISEYEYQSCNTGSYNDCLEPFFGHAAEYEMTVCEQYYGAAIAAAVCGLEYCGIPCDQNAGVVDLSYYHDSYNCGVLNVCELLLTDGPTEMPTLSPSFDEGVVETSNAPVGDESSLSDEPLTIKMLTIAAIILSCVTVITFLLLLLVLKKKNWTNTTVNESVNSKDESIPQTEAQNVVLQ